MDTTTGTEHLPDCWEDDERMGYLFSGFRENRQVNPRDWDNKMKFWSELILKYGRTQRTLMFSLEDLTQKFRRKGVVPQCIGAVMREMNRNGQMVRTDDLEASTTWLSWGVNTFVRKPVRWMMASFFQQTNEPPVGNFVAVELLKEFGEAFLKRHHENVHCTSTGHVVDYSTFKRECVDLCQDDASFDLVLLHLQRTKRVLVTTDDNTKVIKFASKSQKAVSPVTSVELGTLRLKKTIVSMQLTIEKLSGEVEKEDKETRQQLRKGKKTAAKNALRRKKLAQKRLANNESTLDALQQLQERLESSESDKMVLEAYRSGSKALKKTFDDNGLSPETVDDAVSDVQEVMEMCNEIDDTMLRGNKSIDDTVSFGADIDQDLLESELESLISGDLDVSMTTTPSKSTEQTKGTAKDTSASMLDLPEVPSGSPAELDTSIQEDSIGKSMLAS